MEFIRRFLQHVLPHGFMKVRHCGLLHASCTLPLATIRLMIVQAHSSDNRPPPRPPPKPRAARCPTCGAPMRIVMRLWTSHRDCVDTGEEACLCPDELRTTRFAQPTAPVRLSPTIRPHKAAARASATAFQCPADTLWGSSAAPTAMPHHSVRLSIHPLPRRNTLEDTWAGMRGFLEPRIEVTTVGHLNPY